MLFKIVAALIVIGFFAWARKATPASEKTGRLLEDADNLSIDKDIIKVATFNIQTGKSNEGKRDISASADVLRHVDIAGVQEVYAPTLLNNLGVGMAQTQHLANRGQFAWLFSATRRRWFREHRGNSILSKLPTSNWQVHMLPDQSGKSFRNMTVLEIEWLGKKFHFINTHLHTKKGRREQLQVVLNEFDKYERVILLGDFNTTIADDILQSKLKDVDVTDAIKVANLDLHNRQRIDWILTKGFSVVDGTMLEKGVSDHPYYEVTLRYS